MLKIYSYLLEHDFGLAPNPFGHFCTLAVCKGFIRHSAQLKIGDWVIGTGSRALEKGTGKKFVGKLVYAMQVSEVLSLEEYWEDERFAYKKPVMNGSLVKMYGDNFYHKADNGEWIQEPSAHSKADGTPNEGHVKKDTKGGNVLIGEKFFYYGDNAPKLPLSLRGVCHTGVGQKFVPVKLVEPLLKWIESSMLQGIHGDPINWHSYNQLTINAI